MGQSRFFRSELQLPMLAGFEDNNDALDNVSHNRVSKLKKSITILKNRIQDCRAPSRRQLFHLLNLLASVSAFTHLGVSDQRFNRTFKAFGDYDFSIVVSPTQTDVFNCDDYFPLGKALKEKYADIESNFCDLTWATSFGNSCLVDALKSVQKEIVIFNPNAEICADAIEDILDKNYGMWNGYLPVLIIFGMLIPALLSTVVYLLNRGKNSAVELLAEDEAQIIGEAAQEHGIDMEDDRDVEDLLIEFENKLRGINQVGVVERDLVPAISMQRL